MANRPIVLVVEDDNELRRMFRASLSLAGFDAHEAADGEVALNLIDVEPPAAIVLDLGLPVVSGYAVLHEVAAHAQARRIPIVVVTGQEAPLYAPGMARLLRKPVSRDQLVEAVRHCIAATSRSA